MEVLALILTILIYLMLIACLVLYEIGVFTKRYNFALLISKILFLYSFVAAAVESWSLVLMNGGFNVYLDIGADFSYTIFILIPVLALLVLSSILISRNKKEDNTWALVANYLLPALTFVGFAVSTVVLVFNITYFTVLV